MGCNNIKSQITRIKTSDKRINIFEHFKNKVDSKEVLFLQERIPMKMAKGKEHYSFRIEQKTLVELQ